MKKYLPVLLFLLVHAQSFAQLPNVSGAWSSSIPASTITEAGENYTSNWTSLTNQTIISLAWLTSYTVYVKKTDVSWNSNLSLWIHKTGETIGALGNVSPAGNSNYFQLTASNQLFFTASTGIVLSLSAATINVQYEIRGLSVLIPAQSYSTTVVYTISSP
ncbi:hypothetical protein [Emticicia fontis]